MPEQLCGEDCELFSQGGIRIEGKSGLVLAHHMDHFDTGQDDASGGRRFEAKHQPHAPLDAPMVLLDRLFKY
jgi:hypothetical protein